ncbi:MAG: hypothetical protein C0476_09515 [Sphingomonas sp.]|nr:hypothetical protein [Sphingomonas sp.]
MTPLLLIDTGLRLIAIGQLLLIALVICRGTAPRLIRAVTVSLLIGVSAYVTIATPIFLRLSGPLWATVQLFAQATPLLLWVFAHLLFERAINRVALGGGLIVLLSCWVCFALIDGSDARFWIALVQRVVSLVLVLHAIALAIRERGDDLIEKRRRLRVGFVIVVGLGAVMVLVVEMIFGFRHRDVLATLPQTIVIFMSVMGAGTALLQSDPDLLFDPAKPAPPAPTLTPSEQVLKAKLDAAMAGGIHRETGLTIGLLASRLVVPEHRLRALINQRMGHRNFAAFLNLHRIADARVMLADPTLVDLPILTIAMDLGYGSVAPFNRAFRDTLGQTPSDYRRTVFVEKS